MQHPVAYDRLPDGQFEVLSFWQLLLNPWGLLQYAHNMTGAVVTGSFVMAAVGAFYLLEGRKDNSAASFSRSASSPASSASIVIIFPTGDLHGKYVAHNQPAAMAAMEGLFKTEDRRRHRADGSAKRGNRPHRQPHRRERCAELPHLRHHQGRGERARPDSARPVAHRAAAALLRLPHHGRAGTWFVLLMFVAAFLLWRGKLLARPRWMLWALLLSFPLPYIANTAGWMTAELGRQPWLIYGLMRTSEGFSNTVSASNGLFTLLGFMGLYTLLGLLFTVLIYREIDHGPEPEAATASAAHAD